MLKGKIEAKSKNGLVKSYGSIKEYMMDFSIDDSFELLYNGKKLDRLKQDSEYTMSDEITYLNYECQCIDNNTGIDLTGAGRKDNKANMVLEGCKCGEDAIGVFVVYDGFSNKKLYKKALCQNCIDSLYEEGFIVKENIDIIKDHIE